MSFTAWNNQHIVGHHIYTNVAGVDPDLPVNFKNDIRRIVRRQVICFLFVVYSKYKYSHSTIEDIEANLCLATLISSATLWLLDAQVSTARFHPHIFHVGMTNI